jgi:hypothetical protein
MLGVESPTPAMFLGASAIPAGSPGPGMARVLAHTSSGGLLRGPACALRDGAAHVVGASGASGRLGR